MFARQHRLGSLLPNQEDADGVRRPSERGSVHPISVLEFTNKNEVAGSLSYVRDKSLKLGSCLHVWVNHSLLIIAPATILL